MYTSCSDVFVWGCQEGMLGLTGGVSEKWLIVSLTVFAYLVICNRARLAADKARVEREKDQ